MSGVKSAPGEMRIIESFDVGHDWPWRFSVERYEYVRPWRLFWLIPMGDYGYWRTIVRDKKLATCEAVIANAGDMERVLA